VEDQSPSFEQLEWLQRLVWLVLLLLEYTKHERQNKTKPKPKLDVVEIAHLEVDLERGLLSTMIRLSTQSSAWLSMEPILSTLSQEPTMIRRQRLLSVVVNDVQAAVAAA